MSRSRLSLSVPVDARQFRVGCLPPAAGEDFGSFGMDEEPSPQDQEDSAMDVPPSPEVLDDIDMDADLSSESQHGFGMSASPSPQSQHSFGMGPLTLPEAQDDFGMDMPPSLKVQDQGTNPALPKQDGTVGMEVPPLPDAQEFGIIGLPVVGPVQEEKADSPPPAEAEEPDGSPRSARGKSHVQ